MRKSCFILFPTLLFYCLSHSQGPIPKITKSYFRSDPFNTEFSAFISHLVNDPAIKNKVIEKRTDTSLFYFQGTYSTYNPFFFKPKRVQVVLTELDVNLDSLGRDTIYNYQIFAYDNDTKEGREEVKKEFDKIFKRFKGNFSSNQLTENSSETQLKGATYNFFDPLHAVAPFALSWFGPNEDKEMCLVLTIRMDTYLNKAVLPVPLYTSQ